MKKFLLRLAVITVITLIADRTLTYAVQYFYTTTTTTDEFKLNTVLHEMHDPIIFMGSSRCHHHYIPAIITDSLNKGVYNAGLWGMRNIYFQYGLLCDILVRYTPKVICLEIHPTDYLATPFSNAGSAVVLAPYIGTSAGGDEVLKISGYYYKDLISPLYRYNSSFANLLAGNLSTRSFASDKGYKPLSGNLDTVVSKVQPERFPFKPDSEKVHFLQAFINKCKEKNIKLILFFSPMYAVENTTIFEIPDRLAKNNALLFLNHYNLPGITGHAQYFHDFGHLNDSGAQKYSKLIAHELKLYIR